MKTLRYQQDAVGELTEKVIKLLNLGATVATGRNVVQISKIM